MNLHARILDLDHALSRYIVAPIPTPISVEKTNIVTTYQLILSQSGSKYHCCSIKGNNKLRMVNVTIGNAICQPTSGARRVFCCGVPQNIYLNTRVKFSAVKPLTITNTPINKGLIFKKP